MSAPQVSRETLRGVLFGRYGMKRQRRVGWRLALLLSSLMLFLAIWSVVVSLGDYPPFILPSPAAVAERLGQVITDASLWSHTAVTLIEVLAGLGLGALFATLLGYALAHSRVAEQILAPYIVASQSMPTVAIAPLLVIWFGTGLLSKVVVCALIVFFPILINTVTGVRSVDRGLQDLMSTLEASRWQTIWLLEVPAALPVLISGFKVGATLSVIGAVVGEFVASTSGLGYLLKQGQQLYDTPLIFVALATLVLLAQMLYGSVALAEQVLLRGRRQSVSGGNS
ncbi:MAG: ABC transporter permease [Anaerolineales bacterium]|nr:MAG: ABC transporter permease [Anaerolineales bacterium]